MASETQNMFLGKVLANCACPFGFMIVVCLTSSFYECYYALAYVPYSLTSASFGIMAHTDVSACLKSEHLYDAHKVIT